MDLIYMITSYEEASRWHMGVSGPVDEINSFLTSLGEIRVRRIGEVVCGQDRHVVWSA